MGRWVGKWMDGIGRRARRPDKKEKWWIWCYREGCGNAQKMSADHSNSKFRQWFLRKERS